MATPSVATQQFHRLADQLNNADLTARFQAARALKTGYSLSSYYRVEKMVNDILGVPTHRKVGPEQQHLA